MNLTKALREEFVDAVMNGIARHHHFELGDAKKAIAKAIEDQLPEDLKAVVAKYPDLFKRDKYIALHELDYIRTDEKGRSRSVYVYLYVIDHDDAKPVDLSRWVELKKLADDEEYQRRELRSRITQIAAACTTLKKLKEALPELESYMPAEVEKRDLPVAAGTVVTDLMAAGLRIPK